MFYFFHRGGTMRPLVGFSLAWEIPSVLLRWVLRPPLVWRHSKLMSLH
jgi:hypothetical protein